MIVNLTTVVVCLNASVCLMTIPCPVTVKLVVAMINGKPGACKQTIHSVQ